MKKQFLSILGIILLFFVLSQTHAHAGVPKKRTSNIAKKQSQNTNNTNSDVITSEVGLKIPDWGVAIDAVFNPELTDIIPGYHILNLVLSNHRSDTIMLNVTKDKWVVVDRFNKKHTAQNHVTNFNPKVWEQLPQELKQLIDYPTMINPGKSITIDVFVPNTVELTNFKEVTWRSDYFAKEFNLLTNYEQKLSLGSESTKQFDIPKTSVNAEDVQLPNNGQNKQDKFIKSKYSNHPDIGEITDSKTNTQPLFDPSLDDTIIMD